LVAGRILGDKPIPPRQFPYYAAAETIERKVPAEKNSAVGIDVLEPP